MNDITGNIHEKIDALLAWYVNGSLDADETLLVNRHLHDCAECRRNVEFLTGLEADLAATEDSGHVRPRLPEALRRQVEGRRGWQWPAALAASILLAFALGVGSSMFVTDAPLYRTATSSETGANSHSVSVAIRFEDNASVAEFGEFIRTYNGIISSGPGNDGWYRLEITAPQPLDREHFSSRLADAPGVAEVRLLSASSVAGGN